MWKNGLLITALLGLLAGCGRDDAPPAPTTAAPPADSAAGQAAPAAPAATPPAASDPSPAAADPQSATDAPAPAAAGAAAPAAGGGDLAMGEGVYKRTCVTCHGVGLAGAPKLGDAAVWAPRVAQGMDVLYEHSIKGFTGATGMMPPRGANPSLSDEEVRAAVDYMVAQSQ